MTATASARVCPDLCEPLYGAARDLLRIQSIAALRQAVPVRAAHLLGCADCCLATLRADMADLQVVSVAGAPPPAALLRAVADRLAADAGDASTADAFLLSDCCPEIRTAIVARMSSDAEALGVLIASEAPAAGSILTLGMVRYLAFFAGLAADAMHKAEVFERLERHSELLRLGAYVSTAFVGLAREGGSAAIGTLLQQIGTFAGVDRTYLFLISDDGERMSNTHEWCAADVEPMIDLLQEIPVDRGSTFVVTLPRRIPQHPNRPALVRTAL